MLNSDRYCFAVIKILQKNRKIGIEKSIIALKIVILCI